jgi:subtilisin family serine protease
MRRRAYAGPGASCQGGRRRPAGALAILSAGLALAAAAPAAQGGLTPALRARLAGADPATRVPAIVTLAGDARPAPGAGPAAVIRALRREADRTQAALEARTGLRGAGRHWLVNAMSVRATPARLRRLAADPAVRSVSADPAVRPVPEPRPGPRLNEAGSRNWGLDAIRAPQAWRELGVTGAGVRIGTIDTGVDPRHPALAGKIAAWRDFVGGRPVPYDDHGHGTHTAGILVGGDRRRPLGVAPGAKLIVAKAIPGSGVGSGSAVLAAAEWLADPDGDPATADFPQVISNSWGEVADPNDPWFRQVLRRWQQLGIVAVFAAGNTGPRSGTLGSPSGDPEALAVGAVDDERRVAPFSSRGPVAWQNRDGLGPAPGLIVKPDLVGPGVGVVSSTNGGYQALSGTSMASPHVAGVAALVRSADPSLTADEVDRILIGTAADVGPRGRDNDSGAGLVDALAATRRAAGRPGVARTPARRGHRVALTVAQLRINHRIALTAAARVVALEARLGLAPASLGAITASATAPVRRLSAAQMRITQRIAQSALRGATAVMAFVTSGTTPPPGPAAARPGGPVRLTVRQLLINQRIAQTALRRAQEAEARAEAAGMLAPGP